jgi:type IV pilus assembly protein PilV
MFLRGYTELALTMRKKQSLALWQSGVGMIEVLISMMVLSIGLLNIAGLQTAAKKSNFGAIQRTSATLLARDIVEKMRANPVSLDRYLTNGVGGGTLDEPASACVLATRCNSLQLAAYDLWLWEDGMDGSAESRDIEGIDTNTGGMAAPTGCVSGPGAGGAGVYTVTLVWRGLTDLTDVSLNPCGAGSAKYGDNDEFRRILTLSTYISP